MDKGTATRKDFDTVKVFGYYWSGYDDFWTEYHKKDYKRCLKVLKRDISELTRRTNKARIQWSIATGVATEIARRKRRG